MARKKTTETGAAGGSANNEQLLQLAMRAAQEGNQDGARVMFRQVLDRDNRNERALYGLARLAKTPRERQEWLKKLLQVNPDHEGAQAQLEKIQYRRAASDNRTLVLGLFIVVIAIVLLIAVVVLITATV